MMKKNGAVDIICKIFSIVLSIILVPMLIVTVVFSSITNLLKPESLVDVVKQVDYKQLVDDYIDENKKSNKKPNLNSFVSPFTLANAVMPAPNSGTQGYHVTTKQESFGSKDSYLDIDGLNEAKTMDEALDIIMNSEEADKLIEDVLNSEVATEIIDEYTDAISSAIEGEDAQIDPKVIKSIINENKAEIIDIVQEYVGDDVSRNEIVKMFDEFVTVHIDSFVSYLPQPEELVKEVPSEALEVLNLINSGVILTTLIIIDVVICVLIFVLRLRDFAGFLWLGINFIISGILLSIIYAVIHFVKGVVASSFPEIGSFINSFVGVATVNILISFIVILLVAIVFMAAFFVIRHFMKKSKKEEPIMNYATTL